MTTPKTANGVAVHGLQFEEGLIFERSVVGRKGFRLPALDVPLPAPMDASLLREEPPRWPEVSEVDVVRHFTRLSQWNYGIDLNLYPLGSCTMKHNPRINEDMAFQPGFAGIHPLQPTQTCQGALKLMQGLESWLAEITGLEAVTLQPAAGAHGELTGVLLMRAWHQAQGNPRKKILIPSSAHGTNPATASLCGYKVVELQGDSEGLLHPSAVAEAMDEDVAGLMITNPNTLGHFERHMPEISRIIHDQGGLIYGDGANLNAIMGMSRPGDQGIDVMHINLHKTFSTPHGGGGPGGGPVACREFLRPFLPFPVIGSAADGELFLDHDRPQSIGKVRSFMGNFGVLVRAYTYMSELGGDGLRFASRIAVLNANYLWARLREEFHVPFDRPCMHEVVFTDAGFEGYDVSTMDIAKRLIDYGFHPPTVYFPLVVRHAMMIEPTETEPLMHLDQLVEALIAIKDEAETNGDILRSAPHVSVRRRFDEVRAAKRPDLRWSFGDNDQA